MPLDDSFSSSTSTLSYHSTNSTSFNGSPSRSSTLSQASTGIFPLYQNESLTPVDSNLDDISETIADEMSKWKSGLYDISVDISMDLPENETYNKPDMLRAAVYTICGEIFFKHEEWRSIDAAIAFHMGKALNPTSSIWVPVQEKRLMYHGRTNITGHIMGLASYANPGIVHDKIEFNGFICASNVRLDYSVELFFSPAVAGADDHYRNSGFENKFYTCDYKGGHMGDILRGHEAEKLKVYDHHLAWAGVYNVLEGYRNNVLRQNRFFDVYGFSF